MSQDDLDKLRAKVEKDPDSKLFLPLAEEYRKQGMLGEAVDVLLNGIERQPGYTSARVTLGKVYLEMNMPKEAGDEFEKVISLVPDNLFVHKKLAELYRQAGDTDRAILRYRRVLELNPYDEDAKSFLELFESREEEEPSAYGYIADDKKPISDVTPYVDMSLQGAGADEAEAEAEAGEDVRVEEDIKAGEDIKFVEDEGFDEEFEDFNSFLTEESSDLNHDEEAVPDSAAEGSAGSFIQQDESGVRFPEFSGGLFEDSDDMSGHKEGERPSELPDYSYIDSLILRGDYYNAIKSYRQILSYDPDNRHIQQRLAELKSYLEMTGGGNEIIISNLTLFLEEARKRKRE